MACVSLYREFYHLNFIDQFGVRRRVKTEWSLPKDKRHADKLLAQYLAQIDDGKFEAKSQQRDFMQLTEVYLGQLLVREPTRVDYLSIINTHLKPYFASMKLRDITKMTVEKFRTWLQGCMTPGGTPLAVRTINKTLTQLSMMLKYAVGNRWMDLNPCDHVKKIPSNPGEARRARDGNILTAAECVRLYAAAGSQRDAVLFRFAVETACRQGEILGLCWTDIDWHSGKAVIRQSVRKGKHGRVKSNASDRQVPLRPQLLAELKRWKLACPPPPPISPRDKRPKPELVFPNSVGTFENPHNLGRRGFHPALRRAGLRQIRFHDLRHTSASLLLAAGVPIQEVSWQLGHASIQITINTYGHKIPGAKSPGADAMDDIFDCDLTVSEAVPTPPTDHVTHGLAEAPESRNPGEKASGTGLSVVTGMVAREGIEPPTRGFSVRCSTN